MTNLENKLSDNTPLNPNDLPVLAKDRHYLRRELFKAQKELNRRQLTLADLSETLANKIKKSNTIVEARTQSIPTITLNDELPVSQNADTLIQAIKDLQ